MANSNALIVEVVGDTSKLTSSLAKADKDLQRFAGRASSWDKRSPQKVAADFLGDLPERQKQLAAETAAAEERLAAVNSRMGKMAVGAGIAGFAVNRLGANLNELGGTAGKLGGALQDLTSGNIVGFVKGLRSINETDPAKMAQDLLKYGDAAKATKLANTLAAAGFDTLAEAAKNAATQLLAVETAARSAAAEADVAAKILRAGGNEAAVFGENSGRFGRGVGAAAEEARLNRLTNPFRDDTAAAAARRKGITQDQRNTFFDNALARELDRAQDNVSTLRKIAAEIQNEIDARSDVTRKLNLTDKLVAVQRRIEGIQTAAAQESARLAKERAEAEKERLRKLQEAADARRQARQYQAIGLGADGGEVIPRVANLKKQLAQLTSRDDLGGLSSKLRTALRGAGKVLSGEMGKVTADTRSAIQDLFDAIRDELNKGGSGPLTKTTQLSERILAGLGLSAADERILRARISHFNSAGTALAGTGSGSINLTSQTVIDGKVVATTSSKYNRRTLTYNTRPRNGPSAGGYIGA